MQRLFVRFADSQFLLRPPAPPILPRPRSLQASREPIEAMLSPDNIYTTHHSAAPIDAWSARCEASQPRKTPPLSGSYELEPAERLVLAQALTDEGHATREPERDDDAVAIEPSPSTAQALLAAAEPEAPAVVKCATTLPQVPLVRPTLPLAWNIISPQHTSDVTASGIAASQRMRPTILTQAHEEVVAASHQTATGDESISSLIREALESGEAQLISPEK